MRKGAEYYLGKSFKIKDSYNVRIISYRKNIDVDVQLEDSNVIKNCRIEHLISGKVKNPYHPYIFSVGFIGEGIYKSVINGSITHYYKFWYGMMQRCYDEKTHKKQPTYKDVEVCEEWHNFQNFAEWVEKNYNSEYMENWQLDKDILIKGNKTYSPETCCFVPRQINNIFIKNNARRGLYAIGVTKVKNRFIAQININSKINKIGYFLTEVEAFQAYKTEKEQYIKEASNEYKDQITEKVYKALINYKVEITD